MFLRQRRAGLHRRAQEPEGRRRHRARDQAAAPLRDRDAGTDRRAANLQRHAPARLLVWRHLERHPPRHGALEADARRDLSLRGAGVLRADGFPAHAPALDSVLRPGRRDAEIRPAPAPARAIDAVVERCADPAKTRGLVWHTQGSGKTFTLAHRRAADPRRQGALQERDGDPGRRSHRARRAAEGLGRAAARRDAAAGHRHRSGRTPRPSFRSFSTPTFAA